MPFRGVHAAVTWAFLILLPALAARGASSLADARAQPVAARFHHAHYVVGDPAAAMSEAAQRTEGVRVILQGLGVGVRAGREYLLFDRGESGASARRTAAEAYPIAVAQLRAWGFDAAPAAANQSRVAATMSGVPVDHLAFVVGDLTAAAQRLEASGARIVSRRDDVLMAQAADGVAIELVRDSERPETYWCPMHPDVRSADEGKCPLCGMALVPIPPPKVGEYKLDVTQVREADGSVAGLRLAVREPDTNGLATRFAVVHERRLHLFIVSTDLQYFAHVHPDPQPDATFALRHPLGAGEYMLIADLLPETGGAQMIQKAIIVPGPRPRRAAADAANGLDVSMRIDGELAAGKEARLTFTATDAQSKRPVTDLEPFLGAPAHMLLVRADLGDAVHAHPEEQVAAGPTVSFHPLMPVPGAYKLWVQFQRRGHVSTSAFDLVVPR